MTAFGPKRTWVYDRLWLKADMSDPFGLSQEPIGQTSATVEAEEYFCCSRRRYRGIAMRHVLLALLTGVLLVASVPVVMGQSSLSRLPTPAFALPPESVTVTATKPSDATIRNFEETRAQPTYVLGRMARWTKRICPVTVGLADKYAKYITQRIKDVAAVVGAPVNSDPGCRPNIEIMFTLNPQILMNNVRKDKPLLLGYHHNESEADELAKVTHPIQAWYSTISQDLDGNTFVDEGACRNGGTTMDATPSAAQTSADLSNGVVLSQKLLPCAITVHYAGGRAVDGLTSGFFNVVIVADPSKLFDYEIGTLGDYLAMLALSQPASLDSCQDLPSISNLLAKDCSSIPAWITDGDLAYLKGLYRVPTGYSMSAQRQEIQYQMRKTLVTDKGG
jgi:hypothetical protein